MKKHTQSAKKTKLPGRFVFPQHQQHAWKKKEAHTEFKLSKCDGI